MANPTLCIFYHNSKIFEIFFKKSKHKIKDTICTNSNNKNKAKFSLELIEARRQKHILIYFLNLIYFIEVELIYNVVLISAVQQSDSVIHIYSLSDSFPLWFITGY